MRRKIIPASLTTLESFYPERMDETYPVFLVYFEVFLLMPGCADEIMRKKGYVRYSKPAKRGVYFVRKKGIHRFIPWLHKIHDPLNK